jgi:hypothetical protein
MTDYCYTCRWYTKNTDEPAECLLYGTLYNDCCDEACYDYVWGKKK